MKHNLYIGIGLLIGSALLAMLSMPPVMAQTVTITCKDGKSVSVPSSVDKNAACAAHGGYVEPTAAAAPATDTQGTMPAANNTVKCKDNNAQGDCTPQTAFSFAGCGKTDVGIRCLVVEVLRFLSFGVGIAVVGGITVGGITYSTSQGNPGNTQKGIKIITNSVLALILYLLLFAILHFLIPGGVIT